MRPCVRFWFERSSVLPLLIAFAIMGAGPAFASDPGQIHTVTIEGMKFSPSTVRIRVGDKVVFENKDLFPHTATAKPARVFDSGIVKPGESWTFTPRTAGQIRYICTLHPMMEGEIVVEDVEGGAGRTQTRS